MVVFVPYRGGKFIISSTLVLTYCNNSVLMTLRLVHTVSSKWCRYHKVIKLQFGGGPDNYGEIIWSKRE